MEIASTSFISANCGDQNILHNYEVIYGKNRRNGVIDLDKHMKHSSPFQVYRLEDLMTKIDGEIPPSRQSPYMIALIKKGRGEKRIGLFNFPVKNNTLFIVPKRVVHSCKLLMSECSGYMLNFDLDFFLSSAFPKQYISNRRVLKYGIRPYMYLDDQQANVLSQIFESIISEHINGGTEKKEMIAIKLLELLIDCDRFFSKAKLIHEDQTSHPTVEKFTELVEFHYSQKRNVQYYAEALNIHPNHLNFILKKHSGLNAKESINNRIILESKFLLSYTSFIIKEIAYKLGFDDPNNFSTFFQKCTGTTPLAYRSSAPKLNSIVSS
jgi:AraC family transcriptional regulator, transcriptional activator of pobA